jgi:transcription elongation GreA/GreB family factor
MGAGGGATLSQRAKPIPKAGSISVATPVAKSLIGKAIGNGVGSGEPELEVRNLST